MKTTKLLATTAAGLLAVLALAGCGGEKPVEYVTTEKPITDFHKSEASEKLEPNSLQTGWVQEKDSLQLSLAGTDNCLPEIDRASKDGKLVSIYLKEITNKDCGSDLKVAYFTLDGVKKVESVEIYEFGYDTSFPLLKF